MTNNAYIFKTPEHSYSIFPDPTVPNLAVIESTDREALEELLETLELAGVADNESFDHITIEEDMYQPEPVFYIEVSTSTLALFFQFEFLNYFGAARV